ncbi:hypothetical protein BDZ91DRAFT_666179 [Kalaharituber pfeilii]|nr:hypothetical protein BDZ91DRAFT_666179 [Kalaharituber pfeilii]
MEAHEKAEAEAVTTKSTGQNTTDTEPVNSAAPWAATKKATKADVLDITSFEAFPALGGPVKPVVARTWGAKSSIITAPANGTPINGRSAPVFRQTGQIKTEIASTVELQDHEKIPKSQLKKPMADIGKDIEKKTGTRMQMSTTAAGVTVIIIKGVRANVAQARRELLKEICPKRSAAITIPTSVRPHIIGRGGGTIKRIQLETYTKINIPKMAEGEAPLFEDDGTTIDITVEGDREGIDLARRSINQIVAEKTAHTILRITHIQGKFYPFIAGPHFKTINELQEGKDILITVPEFFYINRKEQLNEPGDPITIKGEKVAANQARETIEKLVNEFKEFTQLQIDIPKNCHQFIAGDRGKNIHDILEATGCTVVLPAPDIQDSSATILGPAARIGDGVNKTMSIYRSYHLLSLQIYKAHPTSPIGGEAHARALVRLWKKTHALQAPEYETMAKFLLPESLKNPVSIDIVAKSEESLKAAEDKFRSLVNSYIPGTIASTNIDPLCHPTIIGWDQKGLKQIYDKYKIQVLIGEQKEYGDEVFLVWEGEDIPIAEIQQKVAEVKELLESQVKEIGDIISETVTLDAKYVTSPETFYSVLQGGTTLRALSQGNVSFDVTQKSEGDGQGEVVIKIRGPSADVKASARRINNWAEESKDSDDPGKEHTIPFEYPAHLSAQLIGSKGANVNKLGDELGVNINLKDGKGEIKGVKISAEVARRRLSEQVKQFEDNTTLKIKVPPEHHRTIIGQGGKFVRRLEEKYGVRINFPKTKEDDSAETGSDTGAPVNFRQLAPDEVMIKGGKKGCAEARSEIEELLKYEIEHGQVVTLSIAAKNVKGLFTTYGKEFKRIREESEAKIDVPNDADQPPESILEIRIKGTKEAVTTAKKDLSKIVNELDQLTVQKITVDKKYHRALIGTSGATLREIVEQAGGPKDRSSQARMVRFPNADSNDNIIKIEGNKAVVEKIVEAINKIVEEKNNQIQDVVDVAPEKHAMLIGRGGAIRQELEAKFKVSIDIPRQNSNGTGVTITGLPADVEAAKAHITELTKETEGKTVEVPRSLHHSVADGGLFIRKLRNELRVTVDHNGNQFPPKPTTAPRPTGGSHPLITDPDEDEDETVAAQWQVVENTPSDETGTIPWVLRGPPDNVAKAKDLITQQIAHVQTQTHVGYLTLPDPSKYRYVVGPNGSQVNKIRAETGCRITIPKERGDGDAIVMWGSEEGLEKAKSIIVNLVKEAGEGQNSFGERRRRRD